MESKMLMIVSGVFTIGQGVVTNFEGLVAMRVLIGIFEAGLIPGNFYFFPLSHVKQN